MATPAWSAPRAGLLGDVGATNFAANVNQLLGTHGITPVYQGTQILTPSGVGGGPWAYDLATQDVSQPFVMSGTAVGRIAVPVLPVGNGADLIVSLYTNSSGSPGTLINSTRIPANWINELAAVSGEAGPSTALPAISTTGNPLALPQFNPWWFGGWTLNVPWTAPSVGSSVLFPTSFALDPVNGYLFALGGNNGSGGNVPYVFSFKYDGAQGLGLPVAQPSLPVALFSSTATMSADTILLMAGDTTLPVKSVYTASWDGAGTVGSWSQQADLPQAFDSNVDGAAIWTAPNGNEYVYVVGGNTGVADTPNVYWAAMQNGQINSWNSGTQYPVGVTFTSVFVADNCLIVTGGTPSSGGALNSTYYTPLASNGAPGVWYPGPPSPVATASGCAAANNVLAVVGGYTNPSFTPTNDVQLLNFGATGPGAWTDQLYNGTLPNPSLDNAFIAMFETSQVQSQLFVTNQSAYATTSVYPTPMISVPIPTTGLTNGTTYHVVLSQTLGTLNDYLRLPQDLNSFPTHPTLLTRAPGASTWTAASSGFSIPFAIYNQSATGPLWHLWEDAGTRISTFAWSTTPNQNLQGILEATQQPGPIMNANSTFTTGIAPWGVGNGTVAQSSTHVQGNLPFSALLTPSGSATQSYIESEKIPVHLLHQYFGDGWVFSPTGYSNVSVILNWYDGTNTFISSSFGTVFNVAANTWTQLTFGATLGLPPSNAVTATVGVYEKGSPPATALLWISAVTMQDASGPFVSTVNEVTYNGLWPSTSDWPPTGVTQLA